MATDVEINALQLVTTRRPFFEQQVQALERQGVASTVVPVPRSSEGTRSVIDYARFHARAVRQSIAADFDLVHANYGLTAPSALCQPTRPVVLSLWGSDVFGTYDWVSDLCCSYCDAVIVMTEEMADQVDCETYVIPHGIDMDRFSTAPSEQARATVGWDATAKHVLFPYDPSRSVKDYSRAKTIVDAVDDQLDVTVRLHAVYGVAHEQIPTYMNAADALLVTSAHEGSPNAVKEALACNLPVIATDVGDIGDVVDGLDSCGVSQSNDELVQMLRRVLESGERAESRSRAQEFSLEQMGRKLKQVYDSVLAVE